jgi:ABC-type lipoprotein release transport system permease subunit
LNCYGNSDPASFVVVSAALLAVTLLAAYVPALRASRVAPMKALRWE